MKARVCHARLLELLHYSKKTGIFTRLVSRGNQKAGDRAGGLSVQGYRCIIIDRVSYQESILAYFYVKGKWPPRFIDHIDRDKTNNKWRNLRLATRSQNGANRGAQINNQLGVKGIIAARGKYRAVIKTNGKQTHVGYFLSIDEAIAAREKIARKMFGEFA